MKALSFWSRVLVGVAVATVLFGVAMVLFGATFLDAIYLGQVDPVFWDGAPPAAAQAFKRFSYAVLGATVAGLGVLIGWVTHHGVRRGMRWAADGVLAATGVWFVLDTTLSIACGVWMNALVNTVFLVALVVPTAMARRHTSAKR